MSLFNFMKKKKEEKERTEKERLKKEKYLIEWQNVVMQDKGDSLYYTEATLKCVTRQQAENDIRIINDCISIAEKTLKPDVFFERLNLLLEKVKHLAVLEKYISFSGISPIEVCNNIDVNYQETVKQFLIRIYLDTVEKAEKMKTEKGKIGKFEKLYISLQNYYKYMNNENIDYIEAKYKEHTKK